MSNERSLYLPKQRYVAALKRIRDLIAGGAELVAIDDDTPGDKETSCTWGLCSREREAWPDAEDHLWPDQFEKHGRVAPRYLKQPCPFARNKVAWGCFSACMIFKPTRKRPTREEAVALYDATIATAERQFGMEATK